MPLSANLRESLPMIGIWHHAPKDFVQRARLWRSADGTFEVRESIRNYHLAVNRPCSHMTIGVEN